jgi:3-deoxy-7-phosphoheptulonate synthase/chorismate mutase
VEKNGVFVMSEKLQQLISQMDGINRQLLHLLSERARMASEIVQEKKRQGISEEEPIGDQQILNELANQNLEIPKGQ